MKRIILLLSIWACSASLFAQEILPKGFSPSELERIERGDFQIQNSRGIASPPPFSNLRSAAEWEEIQALTIAWISYPSILKQIVAAAINETQVIILTQDPAATLSYLTASNAGGPAITNTENITLIDGPYDSIWMRDYAGNTVYGSEVDDLIMVDWIYNRPTRPNDDASPQLIADELGLELYTITQSPEDLVNTGGNWMSDGFGTAFASELILEENQPGNPYGVSAKTEEEIDQIVSDYLGIDRYIKMTALPYDGINHIDMHMKLLDEETLLVGEYPEGISDGPQINANIEYVLANYNSKWGTPYKVVRIPMPDSPSGLWPSSQPTAGFYRTYTNGVFVNNTFIFPTYREQYDTTAFRIYEELLPGYNLVGIDCDNQDAQIISASGAIHCITHSVGVEDPLLISHQPLPDTDNTINPYEVNAYINHRSGIVSARIFWKTNLSDAYTEVAMAATIDNNWQGFIPAQAAGTTVYYYIEGTSNSGKVQDRPITAPEGYWKFIVTGEVVGVNESAIQFGKVFPNPASAITCIPVHFNENETGKVVLVNMAGQVVHEVYKGSFNSGEKKFFIDASLFANGVYTLRVIGDRGSSSYPIVIHH